MLWDQLAFQLEEAVHHAAASAWQWLLDEPWRPLLCSRVGGLFLEKEQGGVLWLEAGSGTLEAIATDPDQFHATMRKHSAGVTETFDYWFLPGLVAALHEAGKIAKDDRCYGMTIPPVFKGGVYSVDNMFVLPAREWFSWTGDLHRQLADLPDGATVRFQVTD